MILLRKIKKEVEMTKSEKKEKELIDARHNLGLYSIRELCSMFGVSRYSLDKAINEEGLKYISPNSKNRFVFLNDYVEFMEKKALATAIANAKDGITNQSQC